MKVITYNNQKDLPVSKRSVAPIVKEVLRLENRMTSEVAIHFISTEEICRLHQQFFNDPSPTDCISFPMDEDDDIPNPFHVLGEVFICPATAIQYANRHHTDPYIETTLYVIHGLLHLFGYDDMTAKDRLIMRRKEKEHLSNLISKKLILRK